MKLLRELLGVTQNVAAVFAQPHMCVSGVADHGPSEQSLKEKPSVLAPNTVRQEQATWLKGLSLARSGVHSKFLPGTPQSFSKIRGPLNDVEKAAGPASKEEHPADLSSTDPILQELAPEEGSEANRPRPRIVSVRSQTWGKIGEKGVLPLCI